MKWRLIDRIHRFDAWREIAGVKAVSFEEYSLLKIFGRKGSLPESLVLESCVELSRWLAMASSEFSATAALASVDAFQIHSESARGDVLEITARVLSRAEDRVCLECAVKCGGRKIASGRIELELLPLAESFDRELAAGLWPELYRRPHAEA